MKSHPLSAFKAVIGALICLLAFFAINAVRADTTSEGSINGDEASVIYRDSVATNFRLGCSLAGASLIATPPTPSLLEEIP